MGFHFSSKSGLVGFLGLKNTHICELEFVIVCMRVLLSVLWLWDCECV